MKNKFSHPLIAILCEDRQQPFVTEFFQLFKVPWEFYVEGRQYDVVIASGESRRTFQNAKLLIIFGSKRSATDVCQLTEIQPGVNGLLVQCHSYQFPVYLAMTGFDPFYTPFMRVAGDSTIVGVEQTSQGQRILRIGYDLFDEVGFLLLHGQPVERAEIPTLDIHIAMLRDWILNAGIPLVEIPPRPYGYDFTVCLTHDVDFIKIRDHGLDRSVLGFLGRTLFPHYLYDRQARFGLRRIVRNWLAVLSLPGVYFGLCRDPWFDIDRYVKLEKGLSSTFFFIPLKDNPGDSIERKESGLRACRYDVKKYASLIDDLIRDGFEIGLHGIDAWRDPERGAQERDIISQLTCKETVGLRMHWLYFSEDSPRLLAQAGFHYDSTLGYNDAIGYFSGTTQVFRLPGASEVYELPLNVMDTSLFYPSRMGLSECEAFILCRGIIEDIKDYGGVLTINWHTRSLSPERNWDSFYTELLNLLKSENVFFASATEAVNWYRKRRSVHFDYVKIKSGRVRIKISSAVGDQPSGIMIRIHYPRLVNESNDQHQPQIEPWLDIPLTQGEEIEVSM